MRVGESVFQRKDGRWEARYCKGRNEKGRILYASVYGRTREEAEQKRFDILKTIDTALLIPPKARKETLSETDASSLRIKQRLEEPLEEEAAHRLESAMRRCCDNIKVSLTLALYMGLSFSEICALKYADIDQENRTVTVSMRMQDIRNRNSVFLPCRKRCVPIPSCMLDFIPENTKADAYVLTDMLASVTTVRKGINLCRRELEKHGFTDNIHPDRISATFIRRGLEAGLNLETVSAITGIEQTLLFRKYSIYVKPAVGLIEHIVNRIPQKEEIEDISPEADETVQTPEKTPPKQMNLLILGAGSQGHMVKEIAEAIGIFGEIAYLDDDPNNPLAIDTCKNYKAYLEKYPIAIPSFGDCQLRSLWCNLLEQAGFILPKLIHPSATISGNVEIQSGTVIEAKVILSSGVKVEKNCIISAGSVIDNESVIGVNTHIGCACTIPKGSMVPSYTRLNAGTIYHTQDIA